MTAKKKSTSSKILPPTLIPLTQAKPDSGDLSSLPALVGPPYNYPEATSAQTKARPNQRFSYFNGSIVTAAGTTINVATMDKVSILESVSLSVRQRTTAGYHVSQIRMDARRNGSSIWNMNCFIGDGHEWENMISIPKIVLQVGDTLDIFLDIDVDRLWIFGSFTIQPLD